MSFDIEEQYDKIYRYCYFKLRKQTLAEDVTQETLLRYLERYDPTNTASAMKCLYTIARNLCIDEYRKPRIEALDDSIPDAATEETFVTSLTVRSALAALPQEEQELLLLRYVNDEPISVIAKLYGRSRFSIYRRLTSASKHFRTELEKEDTDEPLER